MSPQFLLAEIVLGTKPSVARYLAGFTDENHTAQAPGLPNHVAWNLGHLALTMHRVAERLDGKSFLPADFIPGARGNTSSFAMDSISFGSKPAADPAAYPTLARCTAIFDAAADRLAAAVRSAPDAKLTESTPWGQGQTTIAALVARMAFHNGMHTGQIADLRRALGFKSVFA